MFNVGDKVIEKETGDIGTIIGLVPEDDSEVAELGFDPRKCWYIVWETGAFAGKELWAPEHELVVINPKERAEDKDLRAKLDELEAKLAATQLRVNFLEAMLYQKVTKINGECNV